MIQEQEYEVVISEENIPIFILKHKEGVSLNPIILYDGSNHAVFYRTSSEVILFDYLPKEIHKILLSTKFALVFEMNIEQTDVVQDYKVKIKIVKNNPIIPELT